MNNQSLVSVIIVSYNHSCFLKDCLESLINQTYKNWELIVADDASKDDSIQVINQWLDANQISAKKVFHEKNVGLVPTLNECIGKAMGKYIKIIAADDMMFPKLLENSVNKLESLPEDYMMVYSNAKYIDEDGNIGKILLPDTFDFDRNDLERILFRGNIVLALTAMVKKEVYSKLGLYNLDYIIEDYEYWLRVSKAYKIEYIDEVLGYYRLHSDNISKKIDLDEESLRLKIFHDKEGKFSNIITNDILVLYKKNKISSFILDAYKEYKSRSNILYYFLKYKVPYKFYSLKNKILYK